MLFEVSKQSESDLEDDDDTDKKTKGFNVIAVQSNAYKAMAQAFSQRSSKLQAEWCNKIANTFGATLSSQTTPWTVKLAVLEATSLFLKKLDVSWAHFTAETSLVMVNGLLASLEDFK
ncbi:hypothetical protein HDU93_004043, partial [Gonapodya sp. JEL0774]